jgi:hypothetical protein
MAAPAERDLRLMAWNPADPPTPGLLGDVEGDLLAQTLSEFSQDARDQIVQATLDELTQMGLITIDEDERYWLTTAGHAALDDSPGDGDGEGLGGPVWAVTLYKPARDLPWVIGQVTQVTGTGQAEPGLVCLAGVDGRA